MRNLVAIMLSFGALCYMGSLICFGHILLQQCNATYCELPSADAGCHPLRNAVCCEDKQSCCPEDVIEDVVCPDGTICPGQSSCCIMADDSYGCCPYPEGVCCSDEIHCCPSYTACDDQGFCYVDTENSLLS